MGKGNSSENKGPEMTNKDSSRQSQLMSHTTDPLTNAEMITWNQRIVVTPEKSLNFTTAVGAGKWSHHVIVVDTKPGSAARGRLYRGDIIMAINGNSITNNDDLEKHAHPKVSSGGKIIFHLGRKRQNIRPGFVYKVICFDVDLSEELGLSVIQCKDGEGLLITALKNGCVAIAHLQVGDLIREVNERKVKTKQELTNELTFGIFTLGGAVRLGIERAVTDLEKAHIRDLIGDDEPRSVEMPSDVVEIMQGQRGAMRDTLAPPSAPPALTPDDKKASKGTTLSGLSLKPKGKKPVSPRATRRKLVFTAEQNAVINIRRDTPDNKPLKKAHLSSKNQDEGGLMGMK